MDSRPHARFIIKNACFFKCRLPHEANLNSILAITELPAPMLTSAKPTIRDSLRTFNWTAGQKIRGAETTTPTNPTTTIVSASHHATLQSPNQTLPDSMTLLRIPLSCQVIHCEEISPLAGSLRPSTLLRNYLVLPSTRTHRKLRWPHGRVIALVYRSFSFTFICSRWKTRWARRRRRRRRRKFASLDRILVVFLCTAVAIVFRHEVDSCDFCKNVAAVLR